MAEFRDEWGELLGLGIVYNVVGEFISSAVLPHINPAPFIGCNPRRNHSTFNPSTGFDLKILCTCVSTIATNTSTSKHTEIVTPSVSIGM